MTVMPHEDPTSELEGQSPDALRTERHMLGMRALHALGQRGVPLVSPFLGSRGVAVGLALAMVEPEQAQQLWDALPLAVREEALQRVYDTPTAFSYSPLLFDSSWEEQDPPVVAPWIQPS